MRSIQIMLAVAATLAVAAVPGTATAARSADDGDWTRCDPGQVCLYPGRDGAGPITFVSDLRPNCRPKAFSPNTTLSVFNNNGFRVRLWQQNGRHRDLTAYEKVPNLVTPRHFASAARNDCGTPE